MRGRKPKSREQRIAEGNRSKSALPPPLPPAPALPLSAPAGLSGYAVEHWDRIAPDLARLGLLTTRYLESLMKWCMAEDFSRVAYERWVELGRPTDGQAHRLYRDFIAAATAAKAYAVEFGGTPSASARIARDISGVAEKASKFDGLIGGKTSA